MQGFTKGVPIDTDNTLSTDSDGLVPSQKAIKYYVDNNSEKSSNKTDTVAGNTSSSIKYLSVKGYYDWLLQGLTQALSSKTTPVDADAVLIEDSADSNKTKKTTWANIMSTIGSYAQTLTNKTITEPVLSNSTALTTAGAISYDGNVFYGNNQASKKGLIPAKYFMVQHADYTLANSGSAQQLFNGTANGRIALPVGKYKFHCLFYLTGMSATSGNSSFSFVAGTATITNFLMVTIGLDNAPLTSSGGYNGQVSITNAFGTNMQVAGTGTQQISYVTGTFEVSSAGTLTPSITLTTAIGTAAVKIGSFIEIESWGTNTVTNAGDWD